MCRVQGLGVRVQRGLSEGRCRANSERTTQSGPEPGPGFQVNALNPFSVVPPRSEAGMVWGGGGEREREGKKHQIASPSRYMPPYSRPCSGDVIKSRGRSNLLVPVEDGREESREYRRHQETQHLGGRGALNDVEPIWHM